MNEGTATPMAPVQATFYVSTRNGKYKNVPVIGGWDDVFRLMDEEGIRSALVKNHTMGTHHTTQRGLDGEYRTGANY